jgi:hypothetical protein
MGQGMKVNSSAATDAAGYEARRRLLLIGDGAADAATRAIALAGFCAGAPVPLAQAPKRLADQVSTDGVVVRIGEAAETLEPLWPLLCEAAEAGRYKSLVAAPPSLAAPLSALRRPAGVAFLFAPDGMDWLTALGSWFAPAPHRFHDVKNGEVPRLQQISDEVGRIASALAALSEENRAAADAAKGKIRVDAGLVRTMIRARRLRDQFFHSEIFADPAWDMLLDLFAARLEKRRVAVSSLCIAAAVPSTTALRWIKSLCDQGLFIRIADVEDGRRVFIELSDGAAAAMENYLRAAQRISPLAV